MAKNNFVDKFKIISNTLNDITELQEVVVVFYAKPDKSYTFDIDNNDFLKGKQAIADEIMRQLQTN